MILHAAAAMIGLATADALGSQSKNKVPTAEEARRAFLAQNRIDTNVQRESPSSRSTPSSTKSPRSERNGDASATGSSGSSIRVYTKGNCLSSGFPYHPILFECHVHHSKWEAFTSEVIEVTKLSGLEKSSAWAVGMFSSALVSHPLRNTSTRMQEKRTKFKVESLSDGDLAESLQRWNTEYFKQRGLIARLELNEAAMKTPDQQSPIVTRKSHWHLKKEDRERARQERKFVIVLDRLDEEVAPGLDTAIHELDTSGTKILELEHNADAKYHISEVPSHIPEVPVEKFPDDSVRAELSGDTEYAELDADNRNLLSKDSLMVTAETHAALHREYG